MECVPLLLQGDCIDHMNKMEPSSVDFILCDLPYGTTACKWDVIIPFKDLWNCYRRVLKDSGVIALTSSQPFTTDLIQSNRKWFRYTWVWDKVAGGNFMNLANRPFKTHEDVVIFSPTANFTFNPIRVPRTDKSYKRYKNEATIKGSTRKTKHYDIHVRDTNVKKDKHPIDIIKFNKFEHGRFFHSHPTKKPVALFRYLVKTYTNKGDTVLDNCAGSGTTGVACIEEGRKSILIEKDLKYCKLIKGRISEKLQTSGNLFN